MHSYFPLTRIFFHNRTQYLHGLDEIYRLANVFEDAASVPLKAIQYVVLISYITSISIFVLAFQSVFQFDLNPFLPFSPFFSHFLISRKIDDGINPFTETREYIERYRLHNDLGRGFTVSAGVMADTLTDQLREWDKWQENRASQFTSGDVQNFSLKEGRKTAVLAQTPAQPQPQQSTQ